MTNRIENATLMKSQTFGIEIETSGLSRPHVARLIAKYYADKYNVATSIHREQSYDASVVIDGIHSTPWKCMSDCSVSEHNEGMAEIVSPILKYEDIEDLQAIMRIVRTEGAKSNANWGCGVHIHIGADIGKEGGHTARTLRNLVNLMASHEAFLFHAFRISHRRQQSYCLPVDANFLRKLNNVRPQNMDAFEALWYTSQGSSIDHSHYNSTRYHALNLHATFTKGTIEFRMFEFANNIHAGDIKAWVQFCLAICSYAKLVRRCSCRPVSYTNEKKAMKDFLDNLGLFGDEFKTCRSRLCRRLTGDFAYANGRPRPVDNTLDDLYLAD